MINAVIIDDEQHGIKSLELLLLKYCPEVKVVATSTDPKQGVTIINDYQPEIVFLDIYMPGLNGFDLLEHLSYKNFHLIFTTAYREYALKALKANAFDYLLKPIDWEELKKTIEKIKTKKSNNYMISELLKIMNTSIDSTIQKVLVPTKTGIECVVSTEIAYIEAQSNQCIVTLRSGESFLSYKMLKEYEVQLCTDFQHFFRLQHSFIVNLDDIVRYSKEDGGYVFMSDDKKISISKFQKKEFLQIFNLERK